MAIIARVNNRQNIGRAVVKSQQKSSIVAPNFAPKPDISLDELNDVTISSLEDGQVIVFNSATNRFENKLIDATNIDINQITGGTF